jgi:predicted site-specific integrase-resolvase
MSGWFRIPQAAEYAGVSPRTLREWMREGLKYSRIHGIVLLKPEWIDEFVERFAGTSNRADEIAEGLMRKVRR